MLIYLIPLLISTPSITLIIRLTPPLNSTNYHWVASRRLPNSHYYTTCLYEMYENRVFWLVNTYFFFYCRIVIKDASITVRDELLQQTICSRWKQSENSFYIKLNCCTQPLFTTIIYNWHPLFILWKCTFKLHSYQVSLTDS